MENKKFNGAIVMLFLLVDKILFRLIYGFSRNKIKYKIDLSTTEFNLLPFYIEEMTYDDFKDIILDYPSRFKYVNIFNSKGEIVSSCELVLYKRLESKGNNKILLSQEDYDCINELRDYIFINCIPHCSFFNPSIFYMYISDKKILNDN